MHGRAERRVGGRGRAGSRILVALLASGAAASVASSARGAEPSTAEALFREARDLLAHGDYAAACPKLEESQRLDPAPGTEFNLGRCYELVGRLASAWGAYADVAAVTHSLGEKEREARARERVAAIEPRLSFVVVKAAARPDGLQLKRDGAGMPLAQLDVAIPVDGGDHVLAAQAPGTRPWETHFQITHEAERVVVEVPSLEVAPPEPAVATAPMTSGTSSVEPNRPAPPHLSLDGPVPAASASSRLPPQRVISLAILGASLVAGGFGTFFGIEKIEAGNQSGQGGANAHSLWEESNRYGDFSTDTFIGCGVLALAAGILWFTAPHAPKSSGVAPWSLRAGTSTGGTAVLIGSW